MTKRVKTYINVSFEAFSLYRAIWIFGKVLRKEQQNFAESQIQMGSCPMKSRIVIINLPYVFVCLFVFIRPVEHYL